jgi:hypothetical protein
MKTWFALSLLFLSGAAASAQPLALNNALKSVSGQFLIYDLRPSGAPARAPLGPNELELEPTVLVVSCERIKQALAHELDAGREWKRTINVTLRAGRPGGAPKINVERFATTWNYRVTLPPRLPRDEFTRTIVQVLLLELANRTPSDHCAEIPLWLSEGLTQRLLAAQEVELVLPNPRVPVGTMLMAPAHVLKRDPDPLARARQILRDRPPPSIAELSWPEVEKLSPAAAEYFQVSAQLFVAELLELKRGPELLRTFTTRLPTVFNWQTAFWQAYPTNFPNQLALEKWWALQAAHFVGRDNKQLWTPAESAQKLDEVLHIAIAVRTRPEELPTRTDVPLQTVLREWDTVRQLKTAQDKILELDRLRIRVAPAYMKIVAEYQAVLREFMQQRSRSSATFGIFKRQPPTIQKTTLTAITKLDALDQQRELLPRTGATELPAPELEVSAKVSAKK